MNDDRDPLGGRHLFETLTRRSDPGQWEQLSQTSRLMWEHRAAGRPDFVPSTAEPHRTTQKIVLPIPAPRFPAVRVTAGTVFWRIVMPGGAKSIVKLAEKEGWLVAVSYCNGPWTMQTDHETSEDGDDLLTKYGQADSVLVRGRKDDLRFAAMWLRRPWTKAGRKPATKQGAGGYQLEYAQVRPAPLETLSNGKVNADQLKQFIRGEDITA
jgi:hypothetical protein